MAYSTTADFEAAFSEDELDRIADRSDDGHWVFDAVVEAAATKAADDEIDLYVGKQYQLPIASPFPTILTALSVDIRRYRMYLDNVPGGVVDRYKNAVAILEAIADGSVILKRADGSIPAGRTVAKIAYGERIMSRDRLKSW